MPTIRTFYGEIKLIDTTYFPYVDHLLVYKKYQGRGYGRMLIKFLPEKCFLEAIPFRQGSLNEEQLLKWYKRNHFRFYKSPITNELVGFRGFRPDGRFWSDYQSWAFSVDNPE